MLNRRLKAERACGLMTSRAASIANVRPKTNDPNSPAPEITDWNKADSSGDSGLNADMTIITIDTPTESAIRAGPILAGFRHAGAEPRGRLVDFIWIRRASECFLGISYNLSYLTPPRIATPHAERYISYGRIHFFPKPPQAARA